LEYFSRSTEEYVIISSSHMICNIDYNEVVEAHIRKNADITLVYKEMDSAREDLSNLIIVDVAENERVVRMTENHLEHEGNKVFMRMIVIKKDLLVELVKKSVTQNYYDLVRHVIIRNLQSLNVQAYEFKGYLAIINSIHNYYKYSMDLLKPQVWKSLFFQPGLIYTKVKDEPPVEYMEGASVRNSLIANGCIIEGTVENSILFRGVKVGKDAVIKNSIVMQKCIIEDGSSLDYVILDKDVFVSSGNMLAGEPMIPMVLTKRSSV
jgi:glucose-1-phosphate adenylyltransferase